MFGLKRCLNLLQEICGNAETLAVLGCNGNGVAAFEDLESNALYIIPVLVNERDSITEFNVRLLFVVQNLIKHFSSPFFACFGLQCFLYTKELMACQEKNSHYRIFFNWVAEIISDLFFRSWSTLTFTLVSAGYTLMIIPVNRFLPCEKLTFEPTLRSSTICVAMFSLLFQSFYILH